MKHIGRAKEYSLIVIAAVLMAEFTLSHLWPTIYFQSMHQDYYDSIVACQKAKESFQKTEETPENLDLHYKLNILVVTNWGSDSISIYDFKNLNLIKEIKTGAQSRSFGDFILQ